MGESETGKTSDLTARLNYERERNHRAELRLSDELAAVRKQLADEKESNDADRFAFSVDASVRREREFLGRLGQGFDLCQMDGEANSVFRERIIKRARFTVEAAADPGRFNFSMTRALPSRIDHEKLVGPELAVHESMLSLECTTLVRDAACSCRKCVYLCGPGGRPAFQRSAGSVNAIGRIEIESNDPDNIVREFVQGLGGNLEHDVFDRIRTCSPSSREIFGKVDDLTVNPSCGGLEHYLPDVTERLTALGDYMICHRQPGESNSVLVDRMIAVYEKGEADRKLMEAESAGGDKYQGHNLLDENHKPISGVAKLPGYKPKSKLTIFGPGYDT